MMSNRPVDTAVFKDCGRKLSSCHLLYIIETIESIHQDSVDLWGPNWPLYMNGLGQSRPSGTLCTARF